MRACDPGALEQRALGAAPACRPSAAARRPTFRRKRRVRRAGRRRPAPRRRAARRSACSARPSPRRRRRRLMPERVARVSRRASSAAGCVAVEHHAVAGEPGGHQARSIAVVADAADGQHVEPLDARARRAPSRAARSLSAAGLAGGGHAVGDQQHARAPAPVAGASSAASAARARDRRRPARRRVEERWRTTSPSALAVPGEDRRHLLVEGGDGQRRVAAPCAARRPGRRTAATCVGEAQRARGAGVDQHLQRRRSSSRAVAVGERDDARHDQVVVAQARARPPGAGVRDLEVAVGREVLLVDLDDLALARSPPRLDAGRRWPPVCRPARGSPAGRRWAARAAADGTARPRASAPASRRRSAPCRARPGSGRRAPRTRCPPPPPAAPGPAGGAGSPRRRRAPPAARRPRPPASRRRSASRSG